MDSLMGISCARRARLLAGTCVLIAGSSGCTAIADLDRFESTASAGRGGEDGAPDAGREAGRGGDGAGGGGDDAGTSGSGGSMPDSGLADAGLDGGMPTEILSCENPRTLCVRLQGFGAHVIELVQLDLVSLSGNNLRARAILEPFARTDVKDADIVMPLALSPDDVPDDGEDSPLHLEMFADENGDERYTPGEDHDWNLDLPPDAKLVFDHNSAFSSIEPAPRGLGGDFTMRLRDLDAHVGDMFELMVIEKGSGRTVGLWRTHALPSPDHEIVIPDVIDPSLTDGYRIEVYADVNRNYAYDPDVDASRVMEAVPDEDGLDLELEDNPEPLTYQFPFDDGQ
jgi:hypothetical protein